MQSTIKYIVDYLVYDSHIYFQNDQNFTSVEFYKFDTYSMFSFKIHTLLFITRTSLFTEQEFETSRRKEKVSSF